MAMVVPDRRTLIVLTALAFAMTLASGMLMGLEPSPTRANATDAAPYLQKLASTEAPVILPQPAANQRWNAIAIHFSGSAMGNVRQLDDAHRRMGLDGLAYHVVIGNGDGMDDGQVVAGPRWTAQRPGISAGNVDAGSTAPAAIDICLIGDGHRRKPTEAQMRQLVDLVQQLQRGYNIAPENVLLYTDPQTGRGRLFPLAWFRQQLLSYQ